MNINGSNSIVYYGTQTQNYKTTFLLLYRFSYNLIKAYILD